jgi:urease accessory protein
MRAAARVVAEADGRGGTRLVVLRSEAPLLLRRTGAGRAAAEVHLVGGAAGPLGGDRLCLRIEVGEGASLCVRSAAATIALPSRDGGYSQLSLSAQVAAGGRLGWFAEPLVASDGCDHRTRTTLEVADGGYLAWREELVCGRHGEPSGDARLRTTLRYAGAAVYDQQLAVGPAAAGWSGAAVLGPARAVGQLLVVDPRAGVPTTAPIPSCAVFPLAPCATLVSATGRDLREVRASLDPWTVTVADHLAAAADATDQLAVPPTRPVAAERRVVAA